ncbi:MAG TPA: carbon starvation CstA family protein [Myxococcaceae bacterium]|jgi:carbon starvation protein
MPLWVLTIAVAVAFLAAFRLYGRFLARRFALDDARTTPAVEHADGVDFVATSKPVLLAQHFASIAAAGPVVGPIAAGVAFGWGPSLAWIVLGCIFIGAMHDFSALVASVRHRARSIPEMVKEHLGRRAWMLSLLFIWLSLLYVIVAFTDVTARQFLFVQDGKPIGGGVATSSFLYLAVAVAMGLVLEKGKVRLWVATLVFLPLVFGVILLGQQFPIVLPGANPAVLWGAIILVYCAVASVLPMWLLMQPRGYLGGYFLYVVLAVGMLGLLIGGFRAEYPALASWTTKDGPMFPFLFVTIACGACSGFHGLVCSGTTCKQVSRETHATAVGYGGMLLEGAVAVMALATVMMWPKGSPILAKGPSEIYATGIAHFMNRVAGVDVSWGITFGLLAFATFVYDTLDVATRLGRYLLEELLGLRGMRGRTISIALTLGLPMVYLVLAPASVVMGGKPVPVWQVVWTIFGSSNQLLAALTLLFLAAWLSEKGLRYRFVLIPAIGMLVTTATALVLQLRNALLDPAGLSGPTGLNAILATALLIVAGAFSLEWFRAIRGKRPAPAEAAAP